jgi:hypothetical protein
VSAVPDDRSPEVGGLQNTATNVGASLGTALAGSVLIASLTATLLAGIQANPDVPASVKQQANVELSSGVPFLSDKDLESALAKAGVTGDTATAIVDENAKARLRALRSSLGVIALVAAAALLFAGGIPTRQPGAEAAAADRAPPKQIAA